MTSLPNERVGPSRLYQSRVAFWLALSLLVPLAALAISTFVFDSTMIPGPAVFVAFPFVGLLHVMTVLKFRATLKFKGSGRRSIRELFPRWAPFVVLPFWLSAMSGILGSGNAAEKKDGQYIVNDHGVERVVTKAEAVKGNRLELRFTRSILAGFSAVGLVISFGGRGKAPR